MVVISKKENTKKYLPTFCQSSSNEALPDQEILCIPEKDKVLLIHENILDHFVIATTHSFDLSLHQ
jgi:hypothetical protein